MKLKKGDQVLVLSGKDKGKTGPILRVLPSLNKVVVEGANVVKRAYKPSAKRPQGGIKEEPQPLAAAKVGILHPTKANRASRIGYASDGKGGKVRVYRQAGGKVIK